MDRVVRFSGPRTVDLVEVDSEPLGTRDVRVRTRYSGISAGTEMTAYRGTNPYLRKRWDPEWRLFVGSAASTFDYPVTGWGYEEVGEVVELGPEAAGVRRGDLVWGAWGHRSGAVLPAARAAAQRLPDGLDPMLGVFVRAGAVALNAVLDADVHIGERVAVFGQGVLGLIATQLARLSGANVVAVDALDSRLELAERLGAVATVRAGEDRPSSGEAVKELTGGHGADVTIEISGSYRALHEAIRATAYDGRVVAAGFYQGEALGLTLGEEFHHNRVQLVSSQISGVGARLGRRWDVQRLQRTVLELAADGRLDLRSLVSNVLPVSNAALAYALLDEHPEQALQVVLDFGASAEEAGAVQRLEAPRAPAPTSNGNAKKVPA